MKSPVAIGVALIVIAMLGGLAGLWFLGGWVPVLFVASILVIAVLINISFCLILKRGN